MKQMAEQLNWKAEHQSLNTIIDTMQSQTYLSTYEQRALKKLKKRRLRAKDRINQQFINDQTDRSPQPQTCC